MTEMRWDAVMTETEMAYTQTQTADRQTTEHSRQLRVCAITRTPFRHPPSNSLRSASRIGHELYVTLQHATLQHATQQLLSMRFL